MLENTTPLVGLAPVLDSQTQLVILGSFPGAASLAAQQYYAHPRNQFWPLLASLTGENLSAMPYLERLPRLLAHRIGVWDVLGACQREGSLDSAIKQAQANDFSLLRTRCPQLAKVAFNGKAAGKFAADFAQAGFQTFVLPSSSPAHAMLSFAEKLKLWREIVA